MPLPRDPLMLMSVVNTRLRDAYPDLDALCEDLQISRPELEKTLAAAGWVYSESSRQFVRKPV